MFDKRDDVDMDPGDYYGMIIDVDAHANSLVEAPEPQAYLSQVTLIDDVTLSQEIVETRTYAQAVNSSDTLHKEWQFASEKDLNSLKEINTRTLVPMPSDRHITWYL